MAKITIVGKQEWKTNDRETGELIEGLSYIGYLPSGKPIKFTSKEEYPVHMGEVEYNEKLVSDVTLRTELFGGEVKYKDAKSYPPKN